MSVLCQISSSPVIIVFRKLCLPWTVP